MSVDDRYDPLGTSTNPIPGLGLGSTNAESGTESPNKRQYNPLSTYTSYTYTVSLYVITWDAYKDFVENNRTHINLASPTSSNGAYLIAQSGGINDSETPRAPGFTYDYYIDNLSIVQAISPGETGTSSGTTEIKFTITEPYGFSFISNLKTATDAIVEHDTIKNAKEQRNASKQFFVLGVKFTGYDGDGSPVTQTDGTFERYWDISINSIHYKIDGKVTTYQVSAAACSIQVGLGTKHGMINRDMTARGKTVADLLIGTGTGSFGIITKMNEDERLNYTDPYDRNSYNVAFYGPGADSIANALFVSDADLDKAKTPLAQVNGTAGVNPSAELKAVPNLNARELTIKGATPVVQAVQQIISQSSYITDALKTIYTTSEEPNNISDPPGKQALRWYNLSTKLSNPRFSVKRNDYVFEITYVIQTYETPVVVTSNANAATPYYGPVKRYEYWFTGKNSEILKYEQTLDNTFYNVALIPDGSLQSTGAGAIPLALDKRANQSRLNKNNLGAEIQNEYVNYLLDPGKFASVKFEILGDPDWLIQPSPGNLSKYSKFYGPDGRSINPNAGQVFVEITFKEARDYDTDKGLMHINSNILFWNYPDSIMSELNGAISYRINRVVSMFRGGKFTQELHGTINTFGTNKNQTAMGINQRDSSAGTPASTQSPNAEGDSVTNNGLLANPPASSLANGTVAPTQILDPAQAQQTIANTPNGPLYIDP